MANRLSYKCENCGVEGYFANDTFINMRKRLRKQKCPACKGNLIEVLKNDKEVKEQA